MPGSPEERGVDAASAPLRGPGVAFLLSQLGFLSGRLWAQRLEALDVDARQAMLLRRVAAEEGRSQQALGDEMRIPSSRMVALVDELEERRLIERRSNPTDRRARALFLTPAGREVLARVMILAAEHEVDLTAGLTREERDLLISLLNQIVARQGLPAGIHPGAGA